MADDGVLFSRSKENKNSADNYDIDNPWDDTRLIEAYERAVSLAKSGLLKTAGNNKDDKTVNKTDSFKESTTKSATSAFQDYWKVGSNCRAIWSYDGVEYEAEIVSFRGNRNQARVKFVGYNNEESVKLNSLKPSLGKAARQNQISDSLGETGDKDYLSSSPENHNSSLTDNGMMFPPPPPPHVISYLPKDEQEALSAMLMSWYMSGYHTGYYQGLITARTNSSNKKK